MGLDKVPALTVTSETAIFARALLAATHGDGEVSETERKWIVGSMAARGFSAEVIEMFSNPTYDEGDVEEIVEAFLAAPTAKFSARVVIADAIRAASSDGYVSGERRAVAKLAEALGVSPDIVTEIVS